jgi:hypothetical protein
MQDVAMDRTRTGMPPGRPRHTRCAGDAYAVERFEVRDEARRKVGGHELDIVVGEDQDVAGGLRRRAVVPFGQRPSIVHADDVDLVAVEARPVARTDIAESDGIDRAHQNRDAGTPRGQWRRRKDPLDKPRLRPCPGEHGLHIQALGSHPLELVVDELARIRSRFRAAPRSQLGIEPGKTGVEIDASPRVDLRDRGRGRRRETRSRGVCMPATPCPPGEPHYRRSMRRDPMPSGCSCSSAMRMSRRSA